MKLLRIPHDPFSIIQLKFGNFPSEAKGTRNSKLKPSKHIILTFFVNFMGFREETSFFGIGGLYF
ncbi:hypothetical protein NLD30_12100, partial [SCandidatus Aminicenantes bacterium Aminicenantia_JdfR_composite]|nr:hypothetical protein [SCandidatus Aminicenantes bacterium Aminicenantia_JdfR_composite]